MFSPRPATSNKRGTVPRPNHVQGRPSTASASIGTRTSENRAKPGQKPRDVSIDEIADQLAVKLALPQVDAVPAGMVEGLGEEATERFLRAKIVVLTNELDKVMAEIKENVRSQKLSKRLSSDWFPDLRIFFLLYISFT